MRKLLNKPWFVVLLALGAVVLVAQSLFDFGGSSGRGVAGTAEAVPAEVEEIIDENGMSVGTLRDAVRAVVLPTPLPDPFSSRMVRGPEVADTAPKEPDLTETVRLSAVWEQNGTAFAVINGRILAPGDSVGRLTIESATRDGVWLKHWKGRDFVSVGSEFTLITPAQTAANLRTAQDEG